MRISQIIYQHFLVCDTGRGREKCSSTSDLRINKKNLAKPIMMFFILTLKSFNWERELSNLNGYDSSDLSNLNDIAINKIIL